jgi:hypothetical protein
VNSQRCLMLAVVLLLTACKGESPASSPAEAVAGPATQAAKPGSADNGKCPLRPADVDKLTPYRWYVAQYKVDQAFIPNGAIRVDMCELIGKDDKGQMRTGVMVQIATGAQADAFAKHWHAACADSIMPDARGKVQPLPGVPGGRQCVTANGSSSHYWIEAPGRTIQLDVETEDAAALKVLPQLVAAAAR